MAPCSHLVVPQRCSRSSLVCAVAAIASLGASSAVAGPTVTVRIEGEKATLPQTTVTLNAPEPVSNCAANSVAAAINLAVGGNWDHGESNGGAGNFTETILGETHDFTHNSDTWAEWVDYKWGGGICTDTLSEGDEVLDGRRSRARTVLLADGMAARRDGRSGQRRRSGFRSRCTSARSARPPKPSPKRARARPSPVAGASIGGAGATSTPSDAGGTRPSR